MSDHDHFKLALADAVAGACRDLAPGADFRPDIVRPKDRRMGDFACAAAMRLAKTLRDRPDNIAARLLQTWTPPDFVLSAEAVGGYINIRLRPAAKTAVVRRVLADPDNFGRGPNRNEFVHLEFVSANPTGPLHIGHGRGAAYGDSLARILRRAGFAAATEYYLNDAGRQMDILAASAWLRMLNPDPQWDAMPPGSYRGAYLRSVAEAVAASAAARGENIPVPEPDSDALLKSLSETEDEDAAADELVAKARAAWGEKPFAELRVRVRDFIVSQFLKADLNAMGVTFDRWFSEADDLRAPGKIESALAKLRDRAPDALYENDGALWFRASAFGDEKDRVVRRANGEFTYFAADIAYCDDKFSRETPGGVPTRALFYIMGADHHGYAPRLRAVARALGRDPEKIETPLIQFVALKKADALIPMSTRAGRFVPLRELLDAVGTDSVRFFFVARKNDQRLDFDLQTAVAQNADNPVFYVQYARARAAGVLRKCGIELSGPRGLPPPPTDAELAALELDEEMALCEMLGAFGEVLESTAHSRAPHVLANWLRDLAAVFHAYYAKVPALSAPEPARTARISLVAATGEVLAVGLDLLGVSAPKEMTRDEED